MLKLIWISVTLLIVFVGFWAILTQPFTKRDLSSSVMRAKDTLLEKHVRMLAEELPGRSDDPRALDRARDYILEEFSRYGDPELQTFVIKGIEYSNVILKFGSPQPPKLVVGAHYDSFDGLPGADDNASGVAGLLELARLLSELPEALNVELVAFALEEPPYFGTEHMGSYHHAAATGRQVKLMICLEMIGYFRDEPGSQSYPLPALGYLYSDRGDFIALIGRLSEIPAVRTLKREFSASVELPIHSLTFFPIVPGVGLSDHHNYWRQGINAVMITDTAFQRNPHYHTAHDLPDTLDYKRMADVVTGTLAGVIALHRGA